MLKAGITHKKFYAEEKETQRYKMAGSFSSTEREDKQSVFIDKKIEKTKIKNMTRLNLFYKIERGRIERKIKELNNNFYEN